MSSPRFAPFPPARGVSRSESSSNQAMNRSEVVSALMSGSGARSGDQVPDVLEPEDPDDPAVRLHGDPVSRRGLEQLEQLIVECRIRFDHRFARFLLAAVCGLHCVTYVVAAESGVHDRGRLLGGGTEVDERTDQREPDVEEQAGNDQRDGERMTHPGGSGSRDSRSRVRSSSDRSTRPPSRGNAGSRLNAPRMTLSQASRANQALATKSSGNSDRPVATQRIAATMPSPMLVSGPTIAIANSSPGDSGRLRNLETPPSGNSRISSTGAPRDSSDEAVGQLVHHDAREDGHEPDDVGHCARDAGFGCGRCEQCDQDQEDEMWTRSSMPAIRPMEMDQ